MPDGTGGAVFSWYDTASQLQCYAQHVLADGTEAFPHNGSAASTNMTRVRVSPSAAFNPSTGETFLFWEEKDASQSQSGVYGQKFDSGGNRQWTDDGAVVVPVGSDEITQVRCLTEGPGAFVFWVQSAGFAQDRLYGARLDGAGSIDVARFDVASTPNDKSSLVADRSTAGFSRRYSTTRSPASLKARVSGLKTVIITIGVPSRSPSRPADTSRMASSSRPSAPAVGSSTGSCRQSVELLTAGVRR